MKNIDDFYQKCNDLLYLTSVMNRNSDLEKEQMKSNQVYTDILYVEYKYL